MLRLERESEGEKAMTLRILIVDDTRFLRIMLTDILTKSGHEVVGEAENGLIGVEKFKELRPDIVMMDISMPEMDGIEALQEIRTIDPKAIVLICSAMSQRDLISKALKAGANNYVTKPFDSDRINELIKNVLPLVERAKPEDAPVSENGMLREYSVEDRSYAPFRFAEPKPFQQEERSIVNAAKEEEPDHFGIILKAYADAEAASEAETEPEAASMAVPEAQAVAATAPHNVPEAIVPYAISAVELAAMSQPVPQAELQSVLQNAPQPVPQTVMRAEPEAPVALSSEFYAEAALEQEIASAAEVAAIAEIEGLDEGRKEAEAAMMNRHDNIEETGKLPEVPPAEHPVDVAVPNGGALPKAEPRRKNMKNFVSSIMFNWTEVLDDQEVSHFVVYNEHDKTIQIDVIAADEQRQRILLSLDSFSYLIACLEEKGVSIDPNL
ncbi:Protein-glutamate methylesterase/protein-glutamine glutaminase [Paenibacillus sp. CECT 9249]|nr:Protein-glutamate methylesterase/protein-glutamine glutaminase [Paenibacillus sp. CECT 9249]